MQKVVILLVSMLMALTLLSGCGDTKKAEPIDSLSDDAAMEITIATMPSTDKVPIIVAAAKGYFGKYDLKVNIENFQNPTSRNAALQAGEVDGVMSDMIADILYQDADLDMVMTSLIQTDFMVLASPGSGITSFDDIKTAHTSGIALNTLMEYISDKAGPAEKIMLPDVMTRVEQVLSNDIDITVVPEPYGSMAIERGAVKVGTAADLGIDAAVMLFPREFIAKNNKEITAFYKGYNEAVAYLNESGLVDGIELVLAKGEFPEDAQDALLAVKFVALTPPTEAQFNDIQGWMGKNPSFKGPYSYNFKDISDFSFLSEK